MTNCGIIILAAGNSSRLGQPKQVLKFRGKTLIRNAADEAIKVAGKQVMVVTGANKDLVENELQQFPVHIIHNEFWQEGISSSIYIGLITLIKLFPHLNAVIIAVCDQPFVSAKLFKSMIAANDKKIVAAAYAEAIGVPVLFNYCYFAELLNLNGQEGAKTLLKRFLNDLTTVDFPRGELDIDTVEDQIKLKELL